MIGIHVVEAIGFCAAIGAYLLDTHTNHLPRCPPMLQVLRWKVSTCYYSPLTTILALALFLTIMLHLMKSDLDKRGHFNHFFLFSEKNKSSQSKAKNNKKIKESLFHTFSILP